MHAPVGVPIPVQCSNILKDILLCGGRGWQYVVVVYLFPAPFLLILRPRMMMLLFVHTRK